MSHQRLKEQRERCIIQYYETLSAIEDSSSSATIDIDFDQLTTTDVAIMLMELRVVLQKRREALPK